jgi:menaquinone-dependent protoporphyrinogen oxidase
LAAKFDEEKTMTVLVAFATKHGATQGIAERIGSTLSASGLSVFVAPTAAVQDILPYNAYVIGSAVYFGSWLKEATAFVRENQAVLKQRPTWLFSCGPLGVGERYARLYADAQPKQVAALLEALAPRDHHIFSGALDVGKLGFGERAIATLGRSFAPEGDFRDWETIQAWAEGIAAALAVVSPAAVWARDKPPID